ncbi:hypothetical protein G6F68_018646 [Rhizopus microsporus]|nr:hypothetical protein G6F68_018646 [Rhizopus microsporus]
MACVLHFVQQHVDEVQARFDGHHHARLQHAGQAQVGMPRRALDAAAFVAGRETGHVVHLQADQVTDAVREEGGADAGFHGGLRRHLDDAESKPARTAAHICCWAASTAAIIAANSSWPCAA